MVLGIDSSDDYVAIGLADDTGVLISRSSTPGKRNKNFLHQFMDDTLKTVGIKVSDLEGVSVSIGPGSFTGLRVGLAAAKGICWSLNIPLCGISSTEAIAGSVNAFSGKIVAVKDARRNRYYHGEFKVDGDDMIRLQPDREVGAEGIVHLVSNGYRIAGSMNQLKDLLQMVSENNFIEYNPENIGGVIAQAGRELLMTKKNLDVASAAPTYVRNPELGR